MDTPDILIPLAWAVLGGVAGILTTLLLCLARWDWFANDRRELALRCGRLERRVRELQPTPHDPALDGVVPFAHVAGRDRLGMFRSGSN